MLVFFSMGGDEPSHPWKRWRSLNNRRMQGWGVSRRERFEAQERAALQPLPQRAVGMAGMAEAAQGRAELPYPCGQELLLRPVRPGVASMWKSAARSGCWRSSLAAAASGWRCIPVATGINRYVTDASHMEAWQKGNAGLEGFANYEDWLRDESRKIGPHADAWAHRCLGSKDFPPQAFNTVPGHDLAGQPAWRASGGRRLR